MKESEIRNQNRQYLALIKCVIEAGFGNVRVSGNGMKSLYEVYEELTGKKIKFNGKK